MTTADTTPTDLGEAQKQQVAVVADQAALLDLAADAIAVSDMQGRILFWNRGAETMYGWKSHEAVGRHMSKLLGTETTEVPATIEAILLRDGRWEGEVIQYCRDGSQLNVATRWALQRDLHGAPLRILAVNNDITERKRAEMELHVLAGRQSLAAAVAKVGVWEWDLASHTLTWDATMCEIYGIPPVAELPYEGWIAAIHPEDRPGVEAKLQQVVADKGEGSADFRITLADGTIKHLSTTERVVLDDTGQVRRVIGVNVDVTERWTAEAARERIRNDQLRFKDEFLSHVSHELRSPLTAVKQFTSILLSEVAGVLNAEQRSYQQIVMKNTRQLQSMIDDLLDVTRLETGKLTVEPESISVVDVVTDARQTLEGTAEVKKVTISVDLAPDLPSAFADQTRFKQILIILLDNAIKFTPSGGAIHIRAGLSPSDPAFLLIEVADTGCGIAPEVGQRVFERLYQPSGSSRASRKGLGLGLYIARELVTRQGGTIWLESQPDKGSTFLFTVPVFSLTQVIAPLLKNDWWPAESLALLVIEGCLRGGWPTRESQEEWSREARSVLHRCLMPDRDILLPKMSAGPERNRFFVAAFADGKGASILANRIRAQFERLPLKRDGLTVTVSHSMLEPFAPDAGAAADTIIARMAANLEGQIKSRCDTEDPA